MPTFQIQFRRDVTANWESCNPVLLDGELGLEVKEDGSRLFKLGDGVTAWLDLPYSSGPKGEDFKYEDFTPEQLELLRGPKGDAFKYEDFTPAQLATLKGETGETGATGDTGPMPAHRWSGTELQFQDASGAWGQSVDLKGAKGDVADGVEIERRLTEKLNTELEQAKSALEEIVPVASTTTPLAPTKTGSVGDSTEYARADHRHPEQEIEQTPMMYNTKTVLTSSGTYTAPVTGWYRITCIGGGGGGGNGTTSGGGQGGTTTFKTISSVGGSGGGCGSGATAAGGGGGASTPASGYLYLTINEKISYTIGAGGTGGGNSGLNGAGPKGGKGQNLSGTSGWGAAGQGGGNGQGGQSGGTISGFDGCSGNGGANGTGYGGGGGGGKVTYSSGNYGGTYGLGNDGGANGANPKGGNGGKGAIILEYYDSSK